MADSLSFLSVCSGIEAASVAWNPLGWRASAVAEIDPFACHVLSHRHRATAPMFMPDPDAAGVSLLDARRRRAAIKAMASIPGGGTVPNLGDLTQFKEWPDVTAELLVGGTPCQSFSVAGLRQGLRDPRGNLALTYLAIADRYRPDWVVWENVPGVLSSNGGRDFGAFLGGLVKLGYGWAYRVLDAQYIRTCSLPFAVPQRRRRVFVVGYLGDWRPAAAVLFDPQSLRGDPAPRRRSGERAAATLEASLGGCSGKDDPAGRVVPEIANPLTARMHKGVNTTMDEGQTMVAHALRGEGFDASEDGTGRGTPIVPVGFDPAASHPYAIQERAVSENLQAGPDGAGFRDDGAAYTLEARHSVQAIAFDSKASAPQALEDGSTPTLRAMGHAASHANAGGQMAIAFDAQSAGNTGHAASTEVAGALHGGGKHGGRAAVAFAENSRGELRLCGGDGQVSSQLTTGGGKPGQGHPAVATTWAVRRLTPLECERLQGFPDGFTDVPYRGRNLTPDGPRYKALGNSMATNAMEFIGRRIDLVREIMGEAGS